MLKELTFDEVFDYLTALAMKPDYLDCERFTGYAMEFNERVFMYDCGVNKLSVIESPNFPTAGKGVALNRANPITEQTGFPYWGQLFIKSSKRS